MIQVLLEKGSNVNIQGGYLGNVLQAAVVGGNSESYQLKSSDVAANLVIMSGYDDGTIASTPWRF
jgi:hypothetical protein